MTKHRFFIPPENFRCGQVVFPADLQSQMGRVLRLKAGDTVEVLDNQGKVFAGAPCQNPAERLVRVRLSPPARSDTEPRVRLCFILG